MRFLPPESWGYVASRQERCLTTLAGQQLGLFTRDQAFGLGVPRHVIRARLRTRRWIEHHSGVYRIAGAPTTPQLHLLAAVLASGSGAAASHRSAAVLWGLRGVAAGEIEIVVRYPRDPAPKDVRVHRSRTLRPEDVTKIGPIPVTAPLRTLVDLSDVLTMEALEDVLDDALQRKLFSMAKLEAAVSGRRYGVRRIRRLRGLLASRMKGHLGESTFENDVRRLLVKSGLTAPLAQFVVRDENGHQLARVDLAYPDARLAIEADGYAFHSGRRAFERDRVRQNALVNAGWRVLRVTPSQVSNDASAVVRVVARALDFRSVRPK